MTTLTDLIADVKLGAKIRERRQKRQHRTAELIRRLKSQPCADCHKKFPPYVMDFDHRDPNTKRFSMSAGRNRTINLVEEEAKKCDVVCANCHRIRTYNRKHWLRPRQ